MKILKNIFVIVLLSSVLISCSKDDVLEDNLIQATGDEYDDPIEPGEESDVLNVEIVLMTKTTGDDSL
jgi:hypothetical protein